MASALSSFNSTVIRATSTLNPKSSDSNRSVRNTAAAAASNAKWWSPLFGWSTEADYITNVPSPDLSKNGVPQQTESTGSGSVQSRSGRFPPGCFTEEKAKELRKKTSESLAFHDAMYHSAIASRLASDLSSNNLE